MKTVDFSETIAACDLKVGRYRQLIEIIKVCEYVKVKVISLQYIFQVLYVLCFTRPRYQVSVYRTIVPLVSLLIISLGQPESFEKVAKIGVGWIFSP